MKITPFAGTALAALLTLSPAAQAHKLGRLPSHTVVSEAQWITVDASVSNDIFDVDRPFPLQGLTVTGPDGKEARAPIHLVRWKPPAGGRRSYFAVPGVEGQSRR